MPSHLQEYLSEYEDHHYTELDFANRRVNTAAILEDLNRNIIDMEGFDNPSFVTLWYQCRTLLLKCAVSLKSLPGLYNLSPKWFDLQNESIYRGSPTFMLNAKFAFDLSRERKTQSEERRAMWAYYFAILSILGTKAWTSTTSTMIKARLAGVNSPKDLNAKIENMTEEQRTLYEKYTSRRYYDKLMRELQDMGSIVEYGANRHTYISTKLTLKQLITKAMSKTAAAKAKRLSIEKNKLKAEVMAELNANKMEDNNKNKTLVQ